MDRYMDAWLNISIAPDIIYMCAKYELYGSSQSRYTHVEANLAKHLSEGLKHKLTETTLAMAMSNLHNKVLKTLLSFA